MSYFDDASLVMIPSGYKTSKVYSVKPTDGSGDLTFSRSNDTATRVNSAGLIEKVRTNLNLYSEQFDNAYWIKLASSVTANAGTAPDGTTTADKIIPNTTNTSHIVYSGAPAPLSAGEYSMSVYVKASGYSKIALRESESVGFFASFDLTNGTILDSSSNQTNTITSVGDGWYRITSTRSFAGNIALGLIPLLNSYTSGEPFSSYAGDGTSGILVWGAQMEFGVPTEYIGPTLGSAVSVGPVANVPRLDYLGSTCGKLILEPQRTNLITYSEQLNNAAWTTENATVTANATTSPDGYTNADKLVENSATATHLVYSNLFNVTLGQAYTMSAYFKAAERTIVTISSGSGRLSITTTFNLSTGTVTSSSATSSSITSVGNGWYRVTATGTVVSATGAIQPVIYLQTTSAYAGDGTSGLFVWGAQLEAGAYATSYIPTLGSASTRGSDACSKTGISSLIGQTEGTLFVEASLTHSAPSNEYLIQVRADNDNRIFIYREGSTNKLGCFARIGASTIYNAVTAAASTGTIKAAFAYKSGSFAFYVNGVQVATSSATYSLAATLSQFDIDQNNGLENGYYTYAQSIVFPTRLSNSDLAALTA